MLEDFLLLICLKGWSMDMYEQGKAGRKITTLKWPSEIIGTANTITVSLIKFFAIGGITHLPQLSISRKQHPIIHLVKRPLLPRPQAQISLLRLPLYPLLTPLVIPPSLR